MSALREGLVLGLGLVMSMCPQNAFIIRQGLKKEYPYISACICAVCDTILIILSALSISEVIFVYPAVKASLIAIALFCLFIFAVKAISSGLNGLEKPRSRKFKNSLAPLSLTTVLVTGISFSLFEPHAIVDVLIMVGGVIRQYSQSDQFMFLMGVIVSSYLWFAAIVTVSISCAHYVTNPRVWAILDITSGIIMLCMCMVLVIC